MSAPITGACPHKETCPHQRVSLRRRVLANGTVSFGTQCLECSQWRPVKHSSLTPRDRESATAYDQELYDRVWKEWRQRRVGEAEEKKTLWWRWYSNYLRSEKWRAIRDRVLQRDRHLCQACLINTATQVHHLTYQHVGDEPAFELASICDNCHESLHEKRAGDRP